MSLLELLASFSANVTILGPTEVAGLVYADPVRFSNLCRDLSPMLKEIRSLLSIAISSLEEEGKLSRKNAPDFGVDHTRQKGHGDIASNVALVLAKACGHEPAWSC